MPENPSLLSSTEPDFQAQRPICPAYSTSVSAWCERGDDASARVEPDGCHGIQRARARYRIVAGLQRDLGYLAPDPVVDVSGSDPCRLRDVAAAIATICPSKSSCSDMILPRQDWIAFWSQDVTQVSPRWTPLECFAMHEAGARASRSRRATAQSAVSRRRPRP